MRNLVRGFITVPGIYRSAPGVDEERAGGGDPQRIGDKVLAADFVARTLVADLLGDAQAAGYHGGAGQRRTVRHLQGPQTAIRAALDERRKKEVLHLVRREPVVPVRMLRPATQRKKQKDSSHALETSARMRAIARRSSSG